jgi:hypothetical protein
LCIFQLPASMGLRIMFPFVIPRLCAGSDYSREW